MLSSQNYGLRKLRLFNNFISMWHFVIVAETRLKHYTLWKQSIFESGECMNVRMVGGCGRWIVRGAC